MFGYRNDFDRTLAIMDQLRRHNPDATVTVDGPVATIRMPVLAA